MVVKKRKGKISREKSKMSREKKSNKNKVKTTEISSKTKKNQINEDTNFVCVVGKEKLNNNEIKTARKIKEDFVIKTIRNIKQMLNVSSNNKLYVCKKHLDIHIKRRKSFEKSFVLSSTIGIIIFLILAVLPIISTGELNLGAIIGGLTIVVLIVMLAGLIKYVPALEK